MKNDFNQAVPANRNGFFIEKRFKMWDDGGMSDIEKLTKEIIKFRNKRNWKQFHNPKDLALSMVLEAGEVMEHFQWKSEKETQEYIKKHKEHIGDEIADVLKYLLILSHDLKIDVKKAVLRKMQKDDLKYPVNKAKGKHTKYNKL